MKVYGKCNNCQTETSVWTLERTRVELAMAKGDTIPIQCKECGVNNRFSVDDLFAKKSKSALLIAFCVLIFVMPISIYLGINILEGKEGALILNLGTGTLPIIVYALVMKNDQDRVNAFNHSKLRGYNSKIGR